MDWGHGVWALYTQLVPIYLFLQSMHVAKEMSQIIFEGPVNMMSFKHDPAGIEVR